MRVLLTAHEFFPRHFAGTEVLTRDTGLELARRGHDVHVLTVEPDFSSMSSSIEFDDYEYEGLAVHSLHLPDPSDPRERLREEFDHEGVGEHVGAYIERLDPDVVHLFHLARLSGSTLDACLEAEVPTVLTTTDFWAICARNTLSKPSGELCTGPNGISSNCLECRRAERWFAGGGEGAQPISFYDNLAKDALKRRPSEPQNMELVRTALGRTEHLRTRVNRLGAVLAPTELTARMLTENGIREDLVRHSRFGMDLSSFIAARARRSQRKAGTPLRFGFIGTISSNKGVDRLIEAFRGLPASADATLRICGNPGKYPEFGRRVYRLAADDRRISFAGQFPNDQTAAELESIDALVVPSVWYENAPLVVYSALAAGVPVIATDLGGLTELVRHGENGLIFEAGDVDDLGRQLRALVDDRELLARLTRGAEAPRTVEDSVDEMLELYRELGAGEREESGPRDRRVPRALAPAIDARSPSARPSRPGRRLAVARKRRGHQRITATAGAAVIAPPVESPPTLHRDDEHVGAGVEPETKSRGVSAQPRGAPPAFFLVGRAKSGTSWLMRLLNAHPEILCRGEGRFFSREYRRPDARSLHGALAHSPELHAWLASSPWTRRHDPDELVADLTGAVTGRILERAVEESGKRIVGDKTPFTGDDMVREIAEIYEGAQVIHIIRDGRDVAVSATHHVWNHASRDGGIHELAAEALQKRDRYRSDPTAFGGDGESIFTGDELAGVAADWARTVTESRRHAERLLDGRYSEVRYEDLLDNPGPELERILRLLGAEADEATIAGCVDAARFERLSGGRKQGEEDSSAFMRKGVAGDWRNVFTVEDRRQFQAAAGGLLVELGYEDGHDW